MNRPSKSSASRPRRATLRRPLRRRASSLVVTLLVIVVLSTIVVAFMQSMSVERLTAKSAANQYRAVLVSDAAVESALSALTTTTNSGPYSTVFGIDPIRSAPYLFQAKLTNNGSSLGLIRQPQFTTLQSPSAFSNLNAQILLTNAYSLSDKEKGTDITRSITRTSDIYIDLNLPTKALPYGQIGLISGTNAVQVPVNWVYFRDKDDAIVGRYAYWVDDESSKIDLRFAGNTLGPSGSHFRGNGTNLNEISLHVLTNSGLNPTHLPNLFAHKAAASNRMTISQARYGTTDIPDDEWHRLRGYLTQHSLHDDRAPDGRRKLNLNSAVSSTFSPASIQTQVELIRDTILTNIPAFGTRYYKNTAVSTQHQTNYVTKIAANIRDFIDTDRNATVILENGTATTNNQPNFVPYELFPEELPIVGKESIPFLNEYLRIMRVINPVPDPITDETQIRPVTIRAAHYIEFWNLGPSAVTYADLGPNPFVSISNRTKWDNLSSGNPNTLRPMDIRIYLPQTFSIPPGGYAVLTTDGPPFTDQQSGFIGSPSNRYIIPRLAGDTIALETSQPGTWQTVDGGGQTFPTGIEYEDYQVETTFSSTNNRYNLRCYGSAAGSYGDCRERITFANDNGLFDVTLRIFTVRNIYIGYGIRNPQYTSTFIGDNNSNTANNTASGATTEPRISRGDPRSNTESINLDSNTGSAWKEGQSQYGNNLNLVQQTLGDLNYNMQLSPTGVALWRMGWSEYTADAAGNHPTNGSTLYSLGQLGQIYDTSRYSSQSFRSAGRTLRIGQSDDPSNNRNNNSTGADYQNWLGGMGSTNLSNTNFLKNAGNLLNIFRTDDIQAGRINPNSLARGTANPALSALLHNFTFTTNIHEGASSDLSGRPLSTTNLLAAMAANQSNNISFFSVGDVGNLAIFNSSTNLAGINMAIVSDSGKEEFFRRSANLMTTESLSFSIISKAQTGSFRGDRFIPNATATRETTVQLIPEYPANEDRPLPQSWQVKVVKDMFY